MSCGAGQHEDKVSARGYSASVLSYARILELGIFQGGLRFVHSFGTLASPCTIVGYNNTANATTGPHIDGAKHWNCRSVAIFHDKHPPCCYFDRSGITLWKWLQKDCSSKKYMIYNLIDNVHVRRFHDVSFDI